MANKKWKEVLSDAGSYPDDFVIALKDGQTTSLGEMRAYDREHEGELTQRLTAKEQELSRREKNVTEASISIGTMIEKVASASGLTPEELIAGKAPTRRQVAQSADLDENDPLVGTLVKEIKSLRSEIAATRGEVDTVKKSALGPMLNTYLEDYYEGKWDKLSPSLPKGSKVTRDEAIKYAQDNGYKDSRGRLDLSKSVKDLTYEDRVKFEAEKMASDLRKKDDDARVLASAPKPSGTHINVKPDKSLTNTKGQVKSLDEVLLDAASDTELWRGIAGQA